MPADPPTVDPWDYARFLVDEADEISLTKRRVAALYKWDSAIRLFRLTEQRQLFERDPSESDLGRHETLLAILIAIGGRLQLLFEDFTEAELAHLDINRANIAAYVQELKDTYLGWHGPELSPERKSELEQKIFGGTD